MDELNLKPMKFEVYENYRFVGDTNIYKTGIFEFIIYKESNDIFPWKLEVHANNSIYEEFSSESQEKIKEVAEIVRKEIIKTLM